MVEGDGGTMEYREIKRVRSLAAIYNFDKRFEAGFAALRRNNGGKAPTKEVVQAGLLCQLKLADGVYAINTPEDLAADMATTRRLLGIPELQLENLFLPSIAYRNAVVLLAHNVFEQGQAPIWFDMQEDLAAQLFLTRQEDFLWSKLYLPYNTFFVALPPGLLAIQSNTGRHALGYVSLNKRAFVAQGKKCDLLQFAVHGGCGHLNTTGDDYITHFRNFMRVDPTHELLLKGDADYLQMEGPQLAKKLVELSQTLEEHQGADTFWEAGVQISREEFEEQVLRYALTVASYLMSKRVKLTRPRAGEEARLRRKPKKSEEERARLRYLEQDRSCVVSTTLTLDRAVTRAILAGEHRKGTLLTHQSLVRGHMRWQACGPQHRDRTEIFIAPHFRGPESNDGAAPTAHIYRA
jgi:hypothetical protein